MRLILSFALVVGVVVLVSGFMVADSEPALADSGMPLSEAVPLPGGGDSIQCDFCSQPACGCPLPPPGCTGTFECTCSSIDCSRTCDPC